VDDERNIRRSLSGLLAPHYEVTTVATGEAALAAAAKTRFDLVLLDIHLPLMSGLQVLEAFKERAPETGVILITGYASIDSAVEALRQGAADYIRKPASTDEIIGSIRAELARAQKDRQRHALLQQTRELFERGLHQLEELSPEDEVPAAPPPTEEGPDPDRYLLRGPLTIDTYRRTATLRGGELDLTAGEYDLLLCLAQNAPRVLDPQELVKETRGYECSLSEARELIRWQIYLVRQKVEPEPSSPQYVLNVRGQGYVWAGG
jgi:DNA-binding response OmpR family regulator